MDSKGAVEYYSRKDVQKAICHSSKDKEAVARFGEGFGKRPDIIQMPGDVYDFAKRGATSFHVSEERWKDPLALLTGSSKKQLDELRTGWDLIIDIDSKYWDFSKYTTHLIYELLKYYGVKSVSCKFSGSKGWHLGVPFEAFPKEVHGMNTKNLFPEGIRIIASFLIDGITPELKKYMGENEKKIQLIANNPEENKKIMGPILIKEIKPEPNKPLVFGYIRSTDKNPPEENKEIIGPRSASPIPFLELDTVLISSRHLFRAPYSLHEKSGLASVVIDPKKILDFEKDMAKAENVNATKLFLERDTVTRNEGKELIIQAFDWHFEKEKKNMPSKAADSRITEKTFEKITDIIKADYFPPCMLNVLKGGMEDGKKRSLFVLINFLKQMNWPYELIEKTVKDWNSKNAEPLRENYVIAQLLSAKRQGSMMPPNCSNVSYFKETGICVPNEFCPKIKNPVNYAMIKQKIANKK